MSQVSSDWVADAEIAPPLPAVRGTSLLRRSLRLWRTRIGVALVGLLVLVAIIGPYIAPYGPSTPVGVPNANPGGKAVLGTDYLGQDVLSRFLYGGRSILVMAVLATALGLIAGTAVGLVAAYSRNALDDTLMRGMDVLMAFPQIMLGLIAVVIIGPHAWVIVVAIALSTAPRIARVARGAAQPVVRPGLPRAFPRPQRRELGHHDPGEPARASGPALGRGRADYRHRSADDWNRPDRRRHRADRGRHRPGPG